MKKFVTAALLGCAATGAIGVTFVTSTPAHAIPVFDANNHAQSLLIAARTLQQINQQVRQLQNEAQMLARMDLNLARIDFPQLRQLQQRLQQIDGLMGQAQGIDFRVDQLEERLRRLFPQDLEQLLGRDQRVLRAQGQLDAAMSAFRRTMEVQNQIVTNVRDDAEALAEIVARSQGAEGSLQVAQATNQLLALTAKQQLQIQNLMVVQARAESIEQARRGQIEREARASTRRFLGDGRAYTPPANQ